MNASEKRKKARHPPRPPEDSRTDRRMRPSRVSPGGRVGLPQHVLDHTGLAEGGYVRFTLTEGGALLQRLVPVAHRDPAPPATTVETKPPKGGGRPKARAR